MGSWRGLKVLSTKNAWKCIVCSRLRCLKELGKWPWWRLRSHCGKRATSIRIFWNFWAQLSKTRQTFKSQKTFSTFLVNFEIIFCNLGPFLINFKTNLKPNKYLFYPLLTLLTFVNLKISLFWISFKHLALKTNWTFLTFSSSKLRIMCNEIFLPGTSVKSQSRNDSLDIL